MCALSHAHFPAFPLSNTREGLAPHILEKVKVGKVLPTYSAKIWGEFPIERRAVGGC